MKNLSFKSILILFSFALLITSCKWVDDVDVYRRVKVEDLPSTIVEYVEVNYPNATIRRAWRDNDGYEVRLSNGREIEFDLDGVMLYDDGDEYESSSDRDETDDDKYVSVAPDQLPQAILDYVSSTYPDLNIASAQKDDDGYEVFLSNGLELNFALDGTFLYAG